MLWLGIQQMNACSHRALMIITFEYGNLLRLVWHRYNHLQWIVRFHSRWLRTGRVNKLIAMVWIRQIPSGCRLLWQHLTLPRTHIPRNGHNPQLYLFPGTELLDRRPRAQIVMFPTYWLLYTLTPHYSQCSRKIRRDNSCSNVTWNFFGVFWRFGVFCVFVFLSSIQLTSTTIT